VAELDVALMGTLFVPGLYQLINYFD
jgi:hypothetical protein